MEHRSRVQCRKLAKKQEITPLHRDVVSVGIDRLYEAQVDGNTARDTLKALIDYYVPRGNDQGDGKVVAKGSAPPATTISKRISKMITSHGVKDFATGKNFD